MFYENDRTYNSFKRLKNRSVVKIREIALKEGLYTLNAIRRLLNQYKKDENYYFEYRYFCMTIYKFKKTGIITKIEKRKLFGRDRLFLGKEDIMNVFNQCYQRELINDCEKDKIFRGLNEIILDEENL